MTKAGVWRLAQPFISLGFLIKSAVSHSHLGQLLLPRPLQRCIPVCHSLLTRGSPHLLVDFAENLCIKVRVLCWPAVCFLTKRVASCAHQPVPRSDSTRNSSVSLPTPSPWPAQMFLSLQCLFKRHINGILPYAGFLVWPFIAECI